MRNLAGEVAFGNVLRFGHAGVDMFFVLSGFIILFVHAEDIGRPARLGHYLRRRISRIYPLYWAVLAFSVALGARTGLPDPWQLGLDALLAPTANPMVEIAWTLQHEMLFYLVFAVLILHRGAGLALFALWFLAVAAATLGLVATPESGLSRVVSARNVQFLVGMGCAGLLRRREAPLPWLLLLGGAVAFVAVGLAENAGLVLRWGALAWAPYGLPSGAMLLGMVSLERQGRLRVPGPFVLLGDASYSVYLLHLSGIRVAWQLAGLLGLHQGLPPSLLGLALLAGGVLAGLVGTRLVERPLNRGMRALLLPTPALRPAGVHPG
jgi:peptidoglycan/LPS O-acetylase OafA/YrhL